MVKPVSKTTSELIRIVTDLKQRDKKLVNIIKTANANLKDLSNRIQRGVGNGENVKYIKQMQQYLYLEEL